MTPFAKRVYRIVSNIPLGDVRTYAWVAKEAGKPGAARAVGQLMKKNTYPIIIPCHRVVASGGKLGGYVYGLTAKKSLLDLEKYIKKMLVD